MFRAFSGKSHNNALITILLPALKLSTTEEVNALFFLICLETAEISMLKSVKTYEK